MQVRPAVAKFGGTRERLIERIAHPGHEHVEGCSVGGVLSTATSLTRYCSGQVEMDVTGNFAFHTPHHYSAKIGSRGR